MVNLITSYGKDGRLDICDQLFRDCLLNKNNEYAPFVKLNMMEIYNAIIDAYGGNGDIERAIKICKEMENPSIATYIILLKSCSRFGHIEIGEDIWRNLIKDKSVRYD